MLILGQVRLSKGQLCPEGLELSVGARNRKKNHPFELFSIILDPALNQKVHLILYYFSRRSRTTGKDKTYNKRFQRLESHVVTLARSVAHLSSEMRTQHALMQDIETIK